MKRLFILLFLVIISCQNLNNDKANVNSLQSQRVLVPPSNTTNISTLPAPAITYLGSYAAPGMKTPLRIASFPNGNLAVTDPKASLIHIFTKNGRLVRSIGGLEEPLAIGVTSQNIIVTSDGKTKLIYLIHPKGNILGTICPFTDLGRVNDIAIDSADGIWATDSTNNKIVYCKDQNALEIQTDFFPTGIVIKNDLIYVSNYNGNVKVYAISGGYLYKIGSLGAGKGKILKGQGLAIDYLDRLYLAEIHQDQIEIFDTKGGFIGWIVELDRFKLISDILIDSYNRMYVTSYKTGKIEVFGIDEYLTPSDYLDAQLLFVPSSVNLKPEKLNININCSAGKGCNSNSNADQGKIHLYVNVPDAEEPISDISIAGVTEVFKENEGAVIDGVDYESSFLLYRQSLVGVYTQEGVYEVPVEGWLETDIPFYGTATLEVK